MQARCTIVGHDNISFPKKNQISLFSQSWDWRPCSATVFRLLSELHSQHFTQMLDVQFRTENLQIAHRVDVNPFTNVFGDGF